MTKEYSQAKPIFKASDLRDNIGSTFLAHCPRCDTTLIHHNQEKCQKCGLKLDWS